jgi:hypothetical protein
MCVITEPGTGKCQRPSTHAYMRPEADAVTLIFTCDEHEMSEGGGWREASWAEVESILGEGTGE